MALGWDQALAKACIKLGVPFDAYVPFESQPKAWPAGSQRDYYKILKSASQVRIISPGKFTAEAMFVRNGAMVDAADSMLAMWDGSKHGGTWKCLLDARDKGVRIHYLWQEWSSWQFGYHLI
jgi:uncharacterized phage-like protein YoqJ